MVAAETQRDGVIPKEGGVLNILIIFIAEKNIK